MRQILESRPLCIQSLQCVRREKKKERIVRNWLSVQIDMNGSIASFYFLSIFVSLGLYFLHDCPCPSNSFECASGSISTVYVTLYNYDRKYDDRNGVFCVAKIISNSIQFYKMMDKTRRNYENQHRTCFPHNILSISLIALYQTHYVKK